jgi:hypothetical protein
MIYIPNPDVYCIKYFCESDFVRAVAQLLLQGVKKHHHPHTESMKYGVITPN